MVAALSYRTLSLVSMNTTLGLVIFKRFSNSFMDELNVVPESRLVDILRMVLNCGHDVIMECHNTFTLRTAI